MVSAMPCFFFSSLGIAVTSVMIASCKVHSLFCLTWACLCDNSFLLQDTDLHVLDLSHNQLTSAACTLLSSALTKPQAIRAWGPAGAPLGSRKETPGSSSKRLVQTPSKGFNSCLQELNLSWNAIGNPQQPPGPTSSPPLLFHNKCLIQDGYRMTSLPSSLFRSGTDLLKADYKILCCLCMHPSCGLMLTSDCAKHERTGEVLFATRYQRCICHTYLQEKGCDLADYIMPWESTPHQQVIAEVYLQTLLCISQAMYW